MNEDNLFPEEPKPKKRKRLQAQVLEHLRAGHTLTEEIYKKDFGGSSLSAVLHNLKIRGIYEPGEFIVRGKVKDSTGKPTPSYRLAKEEPRVDIPQKEHELDASVFGGEPEVGAFYEEPEFAEETDDEEPPVLKDTPPEVSTIMVGVRGSQPELVIMFKGDEFRPLRHVLTPMEVRYLMTNLEVFMPKRRNEENS